MCVCAKLIVQMVFFLLYINERLAVVQTTKCGCTTIKNKTTHTTITTTKAKLKTSWQLTLCEMKCEKKIQKKK